MHRRTGLAALALATAALVVAGSAEATPRTQRRKLAHVGRMVRAGTLPPQITGARCPPEMTLVDDRFCVDRWEASLVEIVSPGVERRWSPYEEIPQGTAVRAVSYADVVPQAYISGVQAQAACRASSKRLCNPTEWRTACRGPQNVTWGYGASHERGRCNDTAHVSPMYQLYPQVRQSWRLIGMTEMNDPRLNQVDGTVARTGENHDCSNEWGVYDMVGNLHEWTDDPNGTFQGGWYLDTTENGAGCDYRTDAHDYTYHDYSTGFRCCAEPISG
jgi:hypothetical protein